MVFPRVDNFGEGILAKTRVTRALCMAMELRQLEQEEPCGLKSVC